MKFSNGKTLQMGTQPVQIIRTEFLPAQFSRQCKAQVPIGCTFGTHLSSQVDWQAANDHVATAHDGRVQVPNELVNGHIPSRCPFDGTGVAGDEVGGHGGMVGPTLLQGISGKLADLNGLGV